MCIRDRDKALLSRQLVTLKKDVPIKDDPGSFIIKDVNLFNSKIVGEKHVKCSISDSTNRRLDAIAFRSVGTALGKSLLNNYHAHVIGKLKITEWNGRENIQMHIEDVIEL